MHEGMTHGMVFVAQYAKAPVIDLDEIIQRKTYL